MDVAEFFIRFGVGERGEENLLICIASRLVGIALMQVKKYSQGQGPNVIIFYLSLRLSSIFYFKVVRLKVI